CVGTNSTGDPNQQQYVCGDYRLGPLHLPTKLPVSSLVHSYAPFSGLCPGAFLAQWTFPSNGSYRYPPVDGFQVTTDNEPIEGRVKLTEGTKVDRFGSEYGTFLSPKGAPYVERALPPQNLDTSSSAPEYPNGYHVYEVVKAFDVVQGPIAPWFGQPGGGSQYVPFRILLKCSA
ncbi:uncharacterized protein STEHIDRAFT_68064, partial [Stereum hirsutum FP-91666 SS1]